MGNTSQLYEQTRLFFEHHIPSQVTLPLFVAGPVILIVLGLGLAVLGAKLARPAMAVAFAAAGAAGGGLMLGGIGISPVIGVLIGGLVMGIAGYVLHRLWVGFIAAVVIGTLAVGGYGTHSLLPALQSYDQQIPSMTAANIDQFTIPDPNSQAQSVNPELKIWLEDLQAWGQGFWGHATANNSGLEQYLLLIAVGAGVFGLLLGLLMPRFTAISLTSVIGTAFMASGVTALAQKFQPQLCEAGAAHPQAIGIACGTVVLGSLILQTLLTRSDKPPPKNKKKS